MRFFSFFANPLRFKKLATICQPILRSAALIFLTMGLYFSLWHSPADYQQGESVRIMYIHVPAAWLALLIYTSMGVAALFYLIWKHNLADLYARAVAPIGAVMTFICLITGSIWGYPTWGTWWEWDARLTSVLILFFIYIGYILFRSSFERQDHGAFAGSILLIVGLVNIPVIKFSVDWWYTLHQPASLSRLDTPAIHIDMLIPLLLMATGYLCFFGYLAFLRTQTILLKHQKQKERGSL